MIPINYNKGSLSGKHVHLLFFFFFFLPTSSHPNLTSLFQYKNLCHVCAIWKHLSIPFSHSCMQFSTLAPHVLHDHGPCTIRALRESMWLAIQLATCSSLHSCYSILFSWKIPKIRGDLRVWYYAMVRRLQTHDQNAPKWAQCYSLLRRNIMQLVPCAIPSIIIALRSITRINKCNGVYIV